MAKAATSGCLDYSVADSTDPKFLLKEIWTLDTIAREDTASVVKSKADLLLALAPLKPELSKDALGLIQEYKSLIMPYDTEKESTSDSDRYQELFGSASKEDTQRLEDMLELRSNLSEQEQEALDIKQSKAGAELAKRFTNRIN